MKNLTLLLFVLFNISQTHAACPTLAGDYKCGDVRSSQILTISQNTTETATVYQYSYNSINDVPFIERANEEGIERLIGNSSASLKVSCVDHRIHYKRTDTNELVAVAQIDENGDYSLAEKKRNGWTNTYHCVRQ